jgi:hypothetical protein
MKNKTCELTGGQLDAAVALATGVRGQLVDWDGNGALVFLAEGGILFRPSTDYSQGGPIMQTEMVSTMPWDGGPLARLNGRNVKSGQWVANHPKAKETMAGDGQLQAAMRAVVAGHFGSEVELP